MQRTPPLRGEALELRRPCGDRFLRRAREVVAEAHEPGPLLLALGLEALGVGRDAGLRLGDELLLALRQSRELVDNGVLRPVEVVGPRVEPGLDLLLGRRQGLTELVDRHARAFGGRAAAFLGDPAFLLSEQGAGVGARAGQDPFELGGALFCLSRDERVEAALCARELLVDAPRGTEEVAQSDSDELGRKGERHAGGDDGERRARAHAERRPRRCRGNADDDGQCRESPAAGSIECRRGERESRHGNGDAERDLSDRDQIHAVRLRA